MATSKDSKDSKGPSSKAPAGKESTSKAAPARDAADEAADRFGDNIRAGSLASGVLTKAGAAAAVGLGATVVLGMMQGDGFKRFSYSYLTAYLWALAIGLGAVFWVTLQNLVNAKWSVALRRVGELLATSIPVLAILALPVVVPIFLGNDIMYVWANHETVAGDHVLHHKAGYLNSGFFLVRFVFYFGFWTLLGRYFLKQSLLQDKSGAASIAERMQKVAGPGMIAFALTLTFCAFDLIMSLDPYWFSTIFGVYYFASCVLAVHATLILVLMWLQGRGRLSKSITPEHFHDLGKMMFAFTVFWAYIGFSQFMLMWYANIPEETAWYKERFAGDWGGVSWALLILHFVVPFFGLLSRHVKRHRKALAFWAVWVLCEIYLDMYWLVMPNVQKEELHVHLMDITAWIGMAGAVVAALAFAAKNVNLVPVKDPRLPRSLAFENI
ncbi:MAG TPA: hypothetical protein VFQ61_10515 [Polyangiaceae bacterium]|nr:hypothetical protein [Polyangiaceae bacterium]